MEGSQMSFASLPQTWVNAAFVFIRQRLVSQYAEQSGQNREAIYRDARRIKLELEEGQSRENELQAQIELLQAENAELRQQAQQGPFTDPDQVAKYAAQAQAEGVSLPVAQRLLKTLRRTRPRQ
jgi:uncharacterized protein YlxW (UPF0749 family)